MSGQSAASKAEVAPVAGNEAEGPALPVVAGSP